MKIGFVFLNEHEGRGGLENVVLKVVHEFKQQGFETVAYSLYPFLDNAFFTHFDQHYIGNIPRFFHHNKAPKPRFLFSVLLRWELKKMLRAAEGCDVVLLMNLSLLLRKNYDLLLAFKQKSPHTVLLTWFHGSLHSFYKGKKPIAVNIMNCADGHLAISSGMVADLANVFGQRNIHLIHNPTDQADTVVGNPRRLIYLGRIAHVKRVVELVEILAPLQGDWTLDIIGDAADKVLEARLQATIAAHQLGSRVHWHGWQAQPWSCVDEAGVLLLNSKNEGFGLVLVEAMMRGIPCVAADCPTGPADIVQNEVNGWLYPMDEPQACRTIMQEILDGTRPLPSPEQVQHSVLKFETSHFMRNFKQVLLHEVRKKTQH